MCWPGERGIAGMPQTYQEASYGDFSQYARSTFGPIVVTDITCDYEAHSPYIASFDDDRFHYCSDYGPKYNVTLTCGNPFVLKQLLEMIKNTNFDECSYSEKNILNAKISYIGSVETKEDLPSDASIGDMYGVGNSFYIYNGENWDFIFNSTTTVNKDDNTSIKYEVTRYKMKHRNYFKK